MATSGLPYSSDDEICKLHKKLLYTKIAIDYLHESIERGLQRDRFVAASKVFLRSEIAESMNNVEDILMHFERTGQIKLGKYDILKDIVKFNSKKVDDIRKTEIAMIKLGGTVTLDGDSGCDEYLVSEVKSSLRHDGEWHTASSDMENINFQLQEHNIELVSQNSDKCEWFAANLEIHNNLMKESNSILRLVKSNERDDRIKRFVDLSRKSKDLLVSHDDAFHTFATRWRNLNRSLFENCKLIVLLKAKGAEFRGILQSSLFIFFRFESIKMLDIFWNEYTTGSLSTEVQSIVCSDKMTEEDDEVCCLHFSEENYLRHKKYLEERDQMASIKEQRSVTNMQSECSSSDVTRESKTVNENIDNTNTKGFEPMLENVLEIEASTVAESNSFLLGNMAGDETDTKPSAINKSFIDNPTQACGICSKDTSISKLCRNCSITLCDKCLEDHESNPRNKYHLVIPCTTTALLLYGKNGLAQQCPTHPEKDISIYCNECQVPCCISCLLQGHTSHSYTTIEDKFNDAKGNLQDYAKKLETQVRPTLEQMEANDKLNVKRVCQIFDYFGKKMRKKIEEREELSEFRKSEKRIETVKSEIVQKIHANKLALINYNPPSHQSLLPNAPIKQVIPIYFNDTMVLEILREKFQRFLEVVKNYSFKVKIGVHSICISGSMAWVMCWDSGSIYLYDSSGTTEKSKTLEGVEGINDMAISRSGDLTITCVDNKIRRVAENEEVITLVDFSPCGCYGVCLTDKEEIVVCVTDQHDEKYIAVYSSDGSERIREIQRKTGLFTHPYRVVQNGQDLCVVDAGGERAVFCIDQEDNARWVYSGRQTKLQSPFYAHAICADKYQNLLVTDINNHCVHYIDRDGCLIQVILSRDQTQLVQPQGICVDDDKEQIWVGNVMSRDIIIAKYLE